MKVVTSTAAFAVAATVLGVATPALAAPTAPVQVFMETGSGGATFDPANAITTGWWGHEGAGKNGSSFFSIDGKGSAVAVTSTTLANQLKLLGPDANPGNVYVAYVVTSADGSAEKPTITTGETVGQAFTWFDGSTFDGSVAGNSAANDYVDTISTDVSYNAWVNAGSPVVGYNNNLTPIDAAAQGAPASGAHALGKSILNNWAAGTQVSVVYYVSNATAANGEPIVQAGADGRAESAWMPFTTVAMPADHSRDPVGSNFSANYDTIRTSAGYVVTSAAAPTVKLKDSWVGPSGTLTATIADPTSGATLTNASGSVQFVGRAVNATGGAFTNVGSPAAVTSAGTATASITGLTGGQFQEFEAVYTPDAAASTTYKPATSGIDQAFAPYSSTTTLSVTGTLHVGYKQAITATVAAPGTSPTGSVTFRDKGVSIATVTLASGKASFVKALSVGSHSIVATYSGAAGTPPTVGSSSAARSVTIAKAIASITPTLSPVNGRITRGSHAKLTVVVRAPGVAATGTVTLVIVLPNRHKVTVRLSLRSGTAAYVLPAAMPGTTKITITYSGSALINPTTKAIAFTVR